MLIKIRVDYGSVCVFNSRMENPFGDWHSDYIEPGFSWRLGSVLFDVPGIKSEWTFHLSLSKFQRLPENEYYRIVSVPFPVSDEAVKIGSAVFTEDYEIPKGLYNLIFSIYKKDEKVFGGLNFESTSELTDAEIILNSDLSWLSKILRAKPKPT